MSGEAFPGDGSVDTDTSSSQQLVTIGGLGELIRRRLFAIPNGDPAITADALIVEALGCNRAYLYAHSDERVPEKAHRQIMRWVKERLGGKPLHRILGWREFYSLKFEVEPGVFLPRPETETLVETVCERLRGVDDPLICDVGCGTGIVGLTLAVQLPQSRVILTDVNPAAVHLSRRNAGKLGVTERVTVAESDLLSNLTETENLLRTLLAEKTADVKPRELFTAVVSNPPYVESGTIDGLDSEVKDFDPREALDGGADGTDILVKLLRDSAALLYPGGILAVEVAPGQPELLERWLDGHPEVTALWRRPGTVMKDLWGRDRVIVWARL